MSEKLICSLFCKQYQTRAAAYIAEDAAGERAAAMANRSLRRRLVRALFRWWSGEGAG